jgi:hypothetical protein
MAREIRYGDFIREVSLNQRSVSFNVVTPAPAYDDAGNEIPYEPPPLAVRPIDVYRLLTPYAGVRLYDQLKVVVPLAAYLVIFQLLILRQPVAGAWALTVGLLAVVIGLMLFMEGLKLGLMPFAEVIGNTLPKRSSLGVVLLIAFLLGIGVTFAEPAIGALKTVGAIVQVERAPYLYALLNEWAGVLVLVVGMGVGLAAVIGTLRFLHGWSLKPLIYATLVPTLALTAYVTTQPELKKTLGLAWDCGAVTTGPVTVPLVLSLGIGIAAAAGKGRSSLSGFGIVTLASLFPIIGVMVLAIYVSFAVDAAEIAAAAQATAVAEAGPAWYERTPGAEIIGGLRAIVPLVVFLFLVLIYLLRERLQQPGIVLYGLCLSVLGMIVFNVGLTYGLSNLGTQSGGLVPAAFAEIDAVAGSPLYGLVLGIVIAALFAWALGFGATMAEPALNALGITVENLTNGAFKKRLLMQAVSFGVGIGIAVGVLKIIYDVPVGYILVPCYALAAGLTALSSEEFVNVAWDSAGVTTGPVTVPLVLSMGLGFGNAVNAVEGFGILSMASIFPILSVLGTGLYIRLRLLMEMRSSAAAEAAAVTESEGIAQP